MDVTEPPFKEYKALLIKGLESLETSPLWPKVVKAVLNARDQKREIFLVGNGGSAANANHLATDLIYAANAKGKGTFRVHSLASNPSVLSCLANDTGYENIFATQLNALAQAGDLLFVFSGSGNSPNIIKALEAARGLGVISISFLGFDGGKAKGLTNYALHFPVHDMQIAEDLHMIAAHLLLKAVV
jgi:D-sedoheptulose 7-phosphate isomerase